MRHLQVAEESARFPLDAVILRVGPRAGSGDSYRLAQMLHPFLVEHARDVDGAVAPVGFHHLRADRLERLTVHDAIIARPHGDAIDRVLGRLAGLKPNPERESAYTEHLPLYQSQMYLRAGVQLHHPTLVEWVGKAAFHLRPMVQCLGRAPEALGEVFMDETRAPVLDPGRARPGTDSSGGWPETTGNGVVWTLRGWSICTPPVAVASVPSASGAQRLRQMASRHDPVAVGQPRLEQYGCDPVARIDIPGHANVAPNPAAAPRTSSMRPDFSKARGVAMVSSNGHSWLRNAQASSGSPMASATSSSPATTFPAPRIWAAGMLSPRFVDLQAMSVFLSTQS